MKIKVIKGSAPYIDGRICYVNTIQNVKNAEKDIKHYLNLGTKILIKKDNEFVDAEEYFNEEKNIKEETNNLEELKKKAKELNIDNYWVMKEETLREKIAEATN
ncbi:MAG: hypothetical protein ACOCRK_02625 [bacterium]